MGKLFLRIKNFSENFLVEEFLVLLGHEVIVRLGYFGDTLVYGARGLEADGVGNLLLGVLFHSQPENLAILFGQPLRKGVNLPLREHLAFELRARVGDVHNVAAFFDQRVEGDGFTAAVVVPVAHEIVADDAAFVLVVLQRAVFPDGVNHGLPVFFLNNLVGHVAHEVPELRPCVPLHFLVRPDGVKRLEGYVLTLYLAAEIAEDVV